MDFEHVKTPTTYLDAGNFTYDNLSSLDPYLQYPHSPYGVPLALTDSPQPESSPRLDFNTLNMANGGLSDYSYSSGASYSAASPQRPFTPQDGISPPALYSLSGGELSSDALVTGRGRRGSGTHSPSSSSQGGYAAVPRSQRFNPMAAAPRTRAPRRKMSRNDDSDDEDDDFLPPSNITGSTDMRRETIRRQRIESEQRRRDELRDGYRRLKDSLPVSNQKSSKVSLLDRATTHIKYLEMTAQQLTTRLQQAEAEVQRLRTVNEALMLGTAEQRHAAHLAAAVSQSSNF